MGYRAPHPQVLSAPTSQISLKTQVVEPSLARKLDRCGMWTLQDAKNKFSAVVEAALAGTPQEVSRRGKPAVVVLSIAEYQRLLNSAVQARESFADHLMAFPGGDLNRPDAAPRDVDV